jgi:hypothetical protein
MIFKDDIGFPVNETLDGMDSSVRAGIMGTFFPMFKLLNPVSDLLGKYEAELPDTLGGLRVKWLPHNKTGVLLRHPTHVPSNNPKNFTRDQMMCLISALPPEINRRVFWATLKRGFFAQNTERDVVGSKKMRRPHSFYKDSRPSTRTEPMKFNWKGMKFENQIPIAVGEEIETRLFDWADPLLPHHVCHLILCARLYAFYPLFLIGWPLLALSCIFNSKELDSEQNQLQCMIFRAGPFFVWLYKKFGTNWKSQTRYYWDKKHEPEYADAIIAALT